jgi:hypothetical protein
VDEMVDNPENQDVVNAEKNTTAGTSERQEVDNTEKDNDGNVEKERRTKKRNERPSSSDDLDC